MGNIMISKNQIIEATDYVIKEYVNLGTIVGLNEEKEYFLIKLRIDKNQFYEYKVLKKVIQQLKYEDSAIIPFLKNLKSTSN